MERRAIAYPAACTKCGQIKDAEEFYVKYKATGKRMAHCKTCHQLGNAALKAKTFATDPEGVRAKRRQCRQRNIVCYKATARAWRAKNIEHARERYRKWRLANLEKARADGRKHDAMRRETKKEYRKRRAEHYRQLSKLWKQRNAEKLKEWYNAYYATHREEYQARTQLRRNREKQNGGHFSADEWRTLKSLHDNKCLACGRQEPDIKLSPDHVLPICKCGPNDISNIQPLCESCNLWKGSKHIDFRPKQESSQTT